MQGIVFQTTITIETDDLGGYRCYFHDWETRAGWGDTPADAIIRHIEYTKEWLNWENNHAVLS